MTTTGHGLRVTLLVTVSLGLSMTASMTSGDQFNVNTDTAALCRSARDATVSKLRAESATRLAAASAEADRELAACQRVYECKTRVQREALQTSQAIRLVEENGVRQAYVDFYRCLAQAPSESGPGSAAATPGQSPGVDAQGAPPLPGSSVPDIATPMPAPGPAGPPPASATTSAGTPPTQGLAPPRHAATPIARWESTLKDAIKQKVRDKQGNRSLGDGSSITVRLTIHGDGGLGPYQPSGTNVDLASVLIQAIKELRDTKKTPMAPTLWTPPDRQRHTVDLTVEGARHGFITGGVEKSGTGVGGPRDPVVDPIIVTNGVITGWVGAPRSGHTMSVELSGENGFKGVFNVPDALIDAVRGKGRVPADVSQGTLRAWGTFYQGADGLLHFDGTIFELGRAVSRNNYTFTPGTRRLENGQVVVSYD